MKVGIVGLPNVGKSTLFNILTKSKVLEANYPFATINPNKGIVIVPEPRLDALANIFKSQKKIPTQIEFVDIAGLVKNASKGQGLGNQFLSNIRDVDAICHIIRCFDNPNIVNVMEKVDPIEEIEIIETEIILSDLEQIERRIKKTNKQNLKEIEILEKIKEYLFSLGEKKIYQKELSNEEIKTIKNFNLISFKPKIYIGNFEEKDLNNLSENIFFQQIINYSKNKNIHFIPICIILEKKILEFEIQEQNKILKLYKIKNNALNQIIQKSYEILNLQTYFTTGQKESKAWSFLKGMTAPECAGIIHTDFQIGFIKAEVFNYEDLIKYQDLINLKKRGKIRLEGKKYLVQDGDIITFFFNV
ncbi:redox-regulated ATPase YchF [Candidatus Phytoplasma sacchari]|uniref:Ribosome-binding ATPase YchF n=1 Tax=Candidatus Phytoplasma sacchari TaxID=2609813 RepID=A0ABY7M1C3_9MOLU|nr:redox-regulated ATPase YchF [Candidatus Phytoplasma sacchari]KAB8122685.1 redox-regulated ATPase YchF [Candidatus Phytoplasma sacchari]WBL31511.1 redox-regulated ATPase YchF [Candidatus Phytoplasma sacchari]